MEWACRKGRTRLDGWGALGRQGPCRLREPRPVGCVGTRAWLSPARPAAQCSTSRSRNRLRAGADRERATTATTKKKKRRETRRQTGHPRRGLRSSTRAQSFSTVVYSALLLPRIAWEIPAKVMPSLGTRADQPALHSLTVHWARSCRACHRGQREGREAAIGEGGKGTGRGSGGQG